MEKLRELLNQVGMGRAIGGLVAAVVVFGGLLFFATQFSSPRMALLYTDLDLAESGRIVESLRNNGIAYRLRDGGRTVLVPENQVDEQRVILASEGMAGGLGYEIIDRSGGIGTTSFIQKINNKRALEGELSRTIRTLDRIISAKVHVVLPERELFSRDQRNPSASIAVTTSGPLGSGEVQAVQSLVASAVPGLEPTQISIVDQDGRLLARGGDVDPVTGALNSMEELRLQKQNELRNRIENQLAQVVGDGGVYANVAVDLVMARVTQQQTIYDPEGQVVAGTETLEENSRNETGLDNVSVENNLPDASADDGGENSLDTSSRTQEIVNNLNSSTQRTEVREPGDVERITVSVLVDGTYDTSSGEAPVYTPRSSDQIAQLQRLVEAAIGFNQGRGDSVVVEPMQFARPVALEVPTEQGVLEYAQENLLPLLQTLLIALVFLILFFTIVKPIVQKLLESWPQPGAEENELGALEAAGIGTPQLAAPRSFEADGGKLPTNTAELAAKAAAGDAEALAAFNEARETGKLPAQPLGVDAEIDVAQIEGRVQDSALKKVGEIVQAHPEESASIIRTWLYSD